MSQQPWEYVYYLLIPPLGDFKGDEGEKIFDIYLNIAVPVTKEFQNELDKYKNNKELKAKLPIYVTAYTASPSQYKGDKIVKWDGLVTGNIPKDQFVVSPGKIPFNHQNDIPFNYPLGFLKLYAELSKVDSKDYGLTPVDGVEWSPQGVSFKIKSGLFFDVKETSTNKQHYTVLYLSQHPQKFDNLDGFGITRFEINLRGKNPEIFVKAEQQCESLGGIYHLNNKKEVGICLLPLNKEANIKASNFIIYLYNKLLSTINSEEFLKRMKYYYDPRNYITVEPQINQELEEMVNVANKEIIKEVPKLNENTQNNESKNKEELIDPFQEILNETDNQFIIQKEEENPPKSSEETKTTTNIKMLILNDEEEQNKQEQNKQEQTQKTEEPEDIFYNFNIINKDYLLKLTNNAINERYVVLPIFYGRFPSEYRNAKKKIFINKEKNAVEETTSIPTENLVYRKFRERYNRIINEYAVPFIKDGLWLIIPGLEDELYKKLEELVKYAEKEGIKRDEIQFVTIVSLFPKQVVVKEINDQIAEIREDIAELQNELNDSTLSKAQINAKRKQIEDKQKRIRTLEKIYETVFKHDLVGKTLGAVSFIESMKPSEKVEEIKTNKNILLENQNEDKENNEDENLLELS